jgi:hypothetical protein
LIEYIKKEIELNIKDKEKVFFYTNSIYCLENFHQCKKNFDERIVIENDSLNLSELLEIKNVLQTYKNF